MHISNYEPVAIGTAITTGNIGKLADHAARARENIAKLDNLLADLSARLDRLEKRDESTGRTVVESRP
jgi:hypothetical protein